VPTPSRVGYFNRSKFASQGAFLERLDTFLASWPADVPVAAEIRNPKWLTAELTGCLRPHRAVLVLADQSWMPPPLSLVAGPERGTSVLDPVTAPFAYVRLLGDREDVDRRTKTLDRVVIDRTEQIRGDAEAIRRLAGRVPVVVFVNNHFSGFAIETVRELRTALGGMP
jgi:uncharacterized protein YecE (DUF72 family)